MPSPTSSQMSVGCTKENGRSSSIKWWAFHLPTSREGPFHDRVQEVQSSPRSSVQTLGHRTFVFLETVNYGKNFEKKCAPTRVEAPWVGYDQGPHQPAMDSLWAPRRHQTDLTLDGIPPGLGFNQESRGTACPLIHCPTYTEGRLSLGLTFVPEYVAEPFNPGLAV